MYCMGFISTPGLGIGLGLAKILSYLGFLMTNHRAKSESYPSIHICGNLLTNRQINRLTLRKKNTSKIIILRNKFVKGNIRGGKEGRLVHKQDRILEDRSRRSERVILRRRGRNKSKSNTEYKRVKEAQREGTAVCTKFSKGFVLLSPPRTIC